MIDFLNTYVLGACLPPLLLAAGLFFAVRLSFFPYRHPLRSLSRMGGEGGLASSLSALSVALAGTLGVGNVAGVGVALATGGEGALLWMPIGGLLVSFLKYAEITLALDARGRGGSRGALDYIGPTLGKGAATLFSLLTVALALTMGSLLQGQVIAEVLSDSLGLFPLSCGLFLSGITLLLFLGGRRAVERISSILIPILTILYTLAALLVVFVNITSLPRVAWRILAGALSPKSAAGGILGAGIARALRVGLGRGLFSNEAGAGTAPFAHGEAAVREPARQGLFGILEVLIDTVFMCTLTGLAVLSALDPLPSLSGTALVSAAFASFFGQAAGSLVSLSVAAFAFATVACWVSYGTTALGFLTSGRWARRLFALLFSFLLTLGATLTAEGVFGLCDLVLGGMTLVNTVALLKNAKRVRTLSEEYGLLDASIRKDGYARGERRPSPSHGRALKEARSPRSRE